MAATGQFLPGERVEVHGLQSEAGQVLNGSVGIVSCLDASTGRYQIDVEGHGRRALKLDNLRSPSTQDVPSMQAVEESLRALSMTPDKLLPGAQVEVHGLQSESGQALNGSVGVVVHSDQSSGRYQVDLEGRGRRALKPENLKSVSASQDPASNDAERANALETLTQALDQRKSDHERRFHALRAVKDAGLAAKSLESNVSSCLQDASWRIRGAAIEALSSMGCAVSHGATIETLLCDNHGDVRFAAAEALGQGAADRHADALAQALTDQDEGVRMAAAVSLGKAGAKAASKYAGALAALLDSESIQLRLAGANSLAKLGEAVVPFLEQLVKLCEVDSSKEVRLAAALAVAQSGDAADPYEERISKVLEKLEA